MATARTKVVRVENVTPVVHFRDDISEASSLDLRPADITPQPPEDSEEEVDVAVDEESLDEAADIVAPLPEGWPRIPQLFVRQSWDFSTATSPCVNKAVSHLELLQNILEDWSAEQEARLASRLSQQTPALSALPALPVKDVPDTSTPTGRRQLRFVPSSLGSHISGSGDKGPPGSHASQPASSGPNTTPQLSIHGQGAKPDPAGISPVRAALEGVDGLVPYLGAEEVLEEVVALLAKLENDRRDIRDALGKEKHRVTRLGERIDSLASQRMEELPQCVQREHEACAMDINELNWHVSYRSRMEARIKNKVAIAEVLNCRLKEDISFVKKHCPLVEEKLELEMDAMSRIKMAQTDTNDELGTTVERCAKVENKNEEANQKADAERKHIKQDLDNVRKDLQTISEELAGAKMTFNTYIHQCNDYRQQLKDNETELQVLEVRCENTKAAEALQATKVQELQGKIVEQEYEHRRLEDENIEKQTLLDTSREDNKNSVIAMTTSIMEKEEQLKSLRRTNQELSMDIEDHIDKIQDCDRQKIADEKNLARMGKEMERTEDQEKTTEEELAKIQVINNAIRGKLAREEETCVREEEQLKSTADTLRKQVKDEIHSRTVIQSRISSDTTDLSKNQTEIVTKKEKITKKVDEVDDAVKLILDKVVKLRNKHAEKTKIIDGLKSDISSVQADAKTNTSDTNKVKDDLNPQAKKLKDDVLGLDKRIDHMAWKTDMMNKNMEDMAASSKMMGKSMAKTQKIINQLQDELDELTILINTNMHRINDLKDALATATDRMNAMFRRHKDHIKERHQVKQQHEEDYEQNLVDNKVLATKYRQLQLEFIAVKNELLDKYDKRVKMELAIKDLKQVQCLQQHMRAALKEYLKYRGLYNSSELARMEAECATNTDRVGELQGSMDVALDDISEFLRTQMDGTSAHRVAMAKVLAEEKQLALEASKAPPTPANKPPPDPDRLPLGIKVRMPLTIHAMAYKT